MHASNVSIMTRKISAQIHETSYSTHTLAQAITVSRMLCVSCGVLDALYSLLLVLTIIHSIAVTLWMLCFVLTNSLRIDYQDWIHMSYA